mgnify:CR=1 FL=1
MATVKLCDRCGKPINISSARSLRFRKILLTASVFYPVVNDDSDYDLCPDCAMELDKFFKGEATDAVVKE